MPKQPVAIITAAGQGIGAACARSLAERGYRLALMSRSGASVTLARELGGVGMNGSVTEIADLEAVVELALREFGHVDAVVNNTGKDTQSTHASGPGYDPDLDRSLTEIDDAAWQFGFDLYLMNVIRMARVVTPVLQENGHGSIVNISTFAQREPRLMFPVSSTIRGALGDYTKLYADRYAREGIRMNNVLPGYMDNWPMSEDIRRTIPLGRAVSMQELGSTVAFLLSDDAASITGQNIMIDGGVNRGL